MLVNEHTDDHIISIKLQKFHNSGFQVDFRSDQNVMNQVKIRFGQPKRKQVNLILFRTVGKFRSISETEILF